MQKHRRLKTFLTRRKPRPKLKLLLNFGLHATRETAKPVLRHIKEFKPHVYVLESADTLESRRARRNRVMNKLLKKAREDPGKEAELLKLLEKLKRPFDHAVIQAVISTNGLFAHHVEAYSKKQLEGFGWALREVLDSSWVLELLYAGRVPEAMELQETRIRAFAENGLGVRNRRIIRGFMELEGEIGRYGLNTGEIRVLARFGSAHAWVGKRLKELGFEAETAMDAPRPFPLNGILSRLSENPKARITADEGALLLFETLWSITGGPLKQGSEEAMVSDLEGKFQKIGLRNGFRALILEALCGMRREEWLEFFKRRIHGHGE